MFALRNKISIEDISSMEGFQVAEAGRRGKMGLSGKGVGWGYKYVCLVKQMDGLWVPLGFHSDTAVRIYSK